MLREFLTVVTRKLELVVGTGEAEKKEDRNVSGEGAREKHQVSFFSLLFLLVLPVGSSKQYFSPLLFSMIS